MSAIVVFFSTCLRLACILHGRSSVCKMELYEWLKSAVDKPNTQDYICGSQPHKSFWWKYLIFILEMENIKNITRVPNDDFAMMCGCRQRINYFILFRFRVTTMKVVFLCGCLLRIRESAIDFSHRWWVCFINAGHDRLSGPLGGLILKSFLLITKKCVRGDDREEWVEFSLN